MISGLDANNFIQPGQFEDVSRILRDWQALSSRIDHQYQKAIRNAGGTLAEFEIKIEECQSRKNPKTQKLNRKDSTQIREFKKSIGQWQINLERFEEEREVFRNNRMLSSIMDWRIHDIIGGDTSYSCIQLLDTENKIAGIALSYRGQTCIFGVNFLQLRYWAIHPKNVESSLTKENAPGFDDLFEEPREYQALSILFNKIEGLAKQLGCAGVYVPDCCNETTDKTFFETHDYKLFSRAYSWIKQFE
jgi:hypothetical protein